MTGYGKVSQQYQQRMINVEIKTLNGKQADIYLKMPSAYREVESDIRNLLMQKLERGKIEINIWYDTLQPDRNVTLNQAVIIDYLNQLKALGDQSTLPGIDVLLPAVLRLPETLTSQKQEFDADEWAQILQLIGLACDKLSGFRIQEGESIARDLTLRVNNILSGIDEVAVHEGSRKAQIRSRLESALDEIRDKITPDMNRFEQELIYYLEKIDITEEKVRLTNHCRYFLETMTEQEAPGRKLGFIAQEMGREINTLGSKANNSDIQKSVVFMKDELEKIKEQTYNIL